MSATPVAKPELKLSCTETRLLLQAIPLAKNVNEMSEVEVATIKHYLNCQNCRDRGLADILGIKLSCYEAILVWAQ